MDILGEQNWPKLYEILYTDKHTVIIYFNYTTCSQTQAQLEDKIHIPKNNVNKFKFVYYPIGFLNNVQTNLTKKADLYLRYRIEVAKIEV